MRGLMEDPFIQPPPRAVFCCVQGGGGGTILQLVEVLMVGLSEQLFVGISIQVRKAQEGFDDE